MAGLDSLFGDVLGENPDTDPVALSDDLKRILNLPQRDAEPTASQIAEPLSARLRVPGGEQTLRPLQALALVEAHQFRGLLALLPVGEGKTLVTFLLPVLLEAKRPILVVPAKMIAKTEREFRALSVHWTRHPNLRIVSYELISRRPDILQHLAPDVIVCDEVHKLKSPRSACTRRMHRYIREAAQAGTPIAFIGLSGTIAARSFMDWWHLQQWALPPLLQPLPHSYVVVQQWCQALDEKIRARRPLGELWRFVDGKAPSADVQAVRIEFGRRLRRTPGIITADGSSVAASIEVECIDRRIPVIEQALDDMRRTWCTPGGEEFSEGVDLWRHARELANGFYYKWDPAPPEWWMEPRREFHQYIRGVLGGSRTLDTMAQVVQRDAEAGPIVSWQEVKKRFRPNPVPVWIDDTVVDYAADWARSHPRGLVWVEHRAVGQRLQDMGIPYFGEQGVDAAGRSIDLHRGPAAVSSIAVVEGFNLQHGYHENLILNVMPLGLRYEQLFGRTHRYGQLEDTVTFQLLLTADEQRAGFEQARADAAYIQETTGQQQKLCLADYV